MFYISPKMLWASIKNPLEVQIHLKAPFPAQDQMNLLDDPCFYVCGEKRTPTILVGSGDEICLKLFSFPHTIVLHNNNEFCPCHLFT